MDLPNLTPLIKGTKPFNDGSEANTIAVMGTQ